MGDKIPLTSEKAIVVDGYFNISETYNAVKNFLENERHYDMGEGIFTEKNDGNSRYLYSVMTGNFKYSDFLQINIPIKLELKGNEVEVEENGKKVILIKGSAKLVTTAYGDADWMGKRKSTPFMTFLVKMVDKFYGKDSMKKFMKKGADDVDSLVAVFKRNMRANIK